MGVITGNGTIGIKQSANYEFIRRKGVWSLTGETQARQSKTRASAAQSPPRCLCSQRRDVAAAVDVYQRVILGSYRAGNVQDISLRIADLKLDAADSLPDIRGRLEVLEGKYGL